MAKQSKTYVQFSKRMVVLVMTSVTVIIGVSVFGMIYDSQYDQLPEVLRHYLGFAGVVFVAYSGNSAIEKWLVNRSAFPAVTPAKAEDQPNGDG